jgi:hypothetical protein
MTDFQIYRPSLDEILNGTPLTPAEEKLLAACKTIGAVSFGDEVPDNATPENSIRGELIRYLMMGGCEEHQPNAQGVAIFNACITGSLSLRGCRSPLALIVAGSRFSQRPSFNNCEVDTLVLSGSHLPGMMGENMYVKRDLFLRDGFHSSAPIVMTDAQIGGQFNCVGGVFEPAVGPALQVNGLSVSGDVFLRDGFRARGLVDLNGARIDGQLDCSDGCFEQGMKLQSSRVGAEFYFRSVRLFDGTLDLSEAHVACLVDDLDSWNMPNAQDLTGFRYDAVQSAMSVEDRRFILAKHADQYIDTVFHSQPYTHLAGYYQKSGQRQAAAEVLYEREK